MNSPELKYCPGTLAEGFKTYSPKLLRAMFDGKKVSHILPYEPPQKNEDSAEEFIENRKRISIPGVQEKLSVILDKNKLRLTKPGEQGTYLLKPIPRDVKKVGQIPANEHLTMQIARQVYGITTSENVLIFFKDGTPAYITKRFDVKPDGMKRGKEDFASLAGKTKDTAGEGFKYEYSYEEIGSLLKKYVPTWRIEIEKYFTLVLFNYAFSNGDAHLKNFSLLEGETGEYFLSPAYDLLNTRIHLDDTDFALHRGLLADNWKSGFKKKSGHAGSDDFKEFGRRIGVTEKRIEKLMQPFLLQQTQVEFLINRSFLHEQMKKAYLLHYQIRTNLLKA